MKKLLISTVAIMLLAITGVSAGSVEKFTGKITYVQVRTDGQIAVKVLPTGETEEEYHVIKGVNDKSKAMYAMALTALSTGKDVEAWTDTSGWWDTFFLKP